MIYKPTQGVLGTTSWAIACDISKASKGEVEALAGVNGLSRFPLVEIDAFARGSPPLRRVLSGLFQIQRAVATSPLCLKDEPSALTSKCILMLFEHCI